MDTNNIEARAFPIDEPKGSTLAYASIAVNNIAVIRNLRVVDGKKGRFVSMPQSQDRNGMYHDIAFPLNSELRREITEKVLGEYDEQAGLSDGERGYDRWELQGRSMDVVVETKLFPIKSPKAETLAYASASLDGIMVIRGIRVVNAENGLSVEMPQSKDKHDKAYDVAYPLSGELRAKINKSVLALYREHEAEQKPGISEKLAAGIEDAAQPAQPAYPAASAAKSSPGLGD